MKTLNFIGKVFLFILLTVNCWAGYYAWPNCIAVYEFENSAVDATGNGYDGILNGNPFSSADKKFGTYSFTAAAGMGNNIILPPSLTALLATKQKITIQWWTRAQVSAVETFMCYNDIADPTAAGLFWLGKWNLFSNYHFSFVFGNTTNNTGAWGFPDQWVCFSFEYDGTQTRIIEYADGVPKYTFRPGYGTNNPFADHPGYSIRLGSWNNGTDAGRILYSKMDRLVFYDGLKNGAAIEPTYVDGVQVFRKTDMYYYKK